MALAAGLELCLYVLLGLAGPEKSQEHALATAEVINQINPAGELTVRLRTLVPKINTLLLHEIKKGRFTLCTPHQVLEETRTILEGLTGPLSLFSDHYTNYIDLHGRLPQDREQLFSQNREGPDPPQGGVQAGYDRHSIGEMNIKETRLMKTLNPAWVKLMQDRAKIIPLFVALVP